MALSLNGINSYIRLPAIPQMPTNLTMEGWILLEAYGNNTPLFGFASGCQSNLIVGGLSDGTSGRAFLKVGNSMVLAPQATPTNVWVHLAFVMAYQGEGRVSASICLNGIEQTNRLLPAPARVARETNALGHTWCVEGGYLTGTIDEIRIWDKALSPAVIQNNMTKSLSGLEQGLLAYWRLDDETGVIATDSSDQHLDGVLQGRAVWVNSTAPMEPVATTLSADGLTPTNALLHGQVSAYNADTVAWFEWGANTNYGNTAGLTNLTGATGLFSWAAPLEGLSPLTMYHFRAVASNSVGQSYGSDGSFTTSLAPPVVTSLPATQITTTRATFQGTVNPNGVAASAWFEWGASSLYGNVTTPTNLDAVTGTLAVASPVTGLAAGTDYRYRLVVSNSTGIFYGQELSLATLPAANAALVDLSLGQLTLNPPFDPAILIYSATVSNGSPPLALTVTSADELATMAARLLPNSYFWPMTSSIPKSFGPIVAGTNLFEIRVVSRDSSLTNLYTVMVWCEPGTPIVWTITPRELDIHSASLVANVTPNGALTTVWFEWGLSTNYGDLSACTNLLPPYRSQTLMYAKALGLELYTNYHFRAVASNSVGLTYGKDVVFATTRFTEMTDLDLPWSDWGVGGWADYDNNGLLDVILAGAQSWGYDLSRLIRNDERVGLRFGENLLVNALRNGDLAWGDYDNDNNPDLLMTGLIYMQNIGERQEYLYGSMLFRKRTRSWVIGADPGLPGLMDSSVSWGDFDNDGDQDVLMTGRDTNQVARTELYLNGQYGLFSQGSPGLPDAFWGRAVAADYDNDGALDVFLSGYNYSAYLMGIHHNQGGGRFVPASVTMTNIVLERAAWGDFDNDGRLDLLVGADLYHNLGNGTFERKAAVHPYGSYPGVWGDFDNDGLLDIALPGRICRNNGDGTFTPLPNELTNVLMGDFAAWADYDNDGDLDLLVHGYQEWYVFRNNSVVSNTPPSEPCGLRAEISGTKVTFRWDAASDAQTPAPGLTYNLRVGTTPGGTQVVSPLADVMTGRRRVPQMGNAGPRLFSWLTNLQAGVVYYWSVQAVDTAFAGSRFAPEQTFALGGPPAIDPVSAGGASGSSAVLLARIFPGGYPASVWFEWGATTLYGNVTGVLPAGSNLPAVLLRQPVSGLQPGTLYHYRVIAANSLGTNAGPDQTFYTDPASVPGDINQDGVVDQAELEAVAGRYWTQANPPIITSLASLANGLFLMGLSNAPAWNFSVLVSTNLTNWDYLGPAWNVLQFRDAEAARQPARFYRLRSP